MCCGAVLDASSRRIVGWSIDSRPDSSLVVNALDMAIRNRRRDPGGIVHADHGVHGVHGGFNQSSQHLVIMEVFMVRRQQGGRSGSA